MKQSNFELRQQKNIMKSKIKFFNVDFICEFEFSPIYGQSPTDESELGKITSLKSDAIEMAELFIEMGFEHEIKSAILESKIFSPTKTHLTCQY